MSEKEHLESIVNQVNKRIDQGLSIKKEIIEVSNLSQTASKFTKLAIALSENDKLDELNSIIKNREVRYNQKIGSVKNMM
jgi:hypothetical protein